MCIYVGNLAFPGRYQHGCHGSFKSDLSVTTRTILHYTTPYFTFAWGGILRLNHPTPRHIWLLYWHTKFGRLTPLSFLV